MLALHKDICKACLLEAAETEQELEEEEKRAWHPIAFCVSALPQYLL